MQFIGFFAILGIFMVGCDGVVDSNDTDLILAKGKGQGQSNVTVGTGAGSLGKVTVDTGELQFW